MKLCIICKTPIEHGLDFVTEAGPVHMGQCKHYHDEIVKNIQEGEAEADLIEETTVLL